MTAVLRLKRPVDGATPTSFRLPGRNDEVNEMKVGRNGDICDVFLYVDEHPSFLSRVHAKFQHCKGARVQKLTDEGIKEELETWWQVRDNKSVNGVFVNGDKLQPDTERKLRQGDRIFFGNPQHSFFLEYEFTIYSPDSKEAMRFEKQPIGRSRSRKKRNSKRYASGSNSNRASGHHHHHHHHNTSSSSNSNANDATLPTYNSMSSTRPRHNRATPHRATPVMMGGPVQAQVGLVGNMGDLYAVNPMSGPPGENRYFHGFLPSPTPSRPVRSPSSPAQNAIVSSNSIEQQQQQQQQQQVSMQARGPTSASNSSSGTIVNGSGNNNSNNVPAVDGSSSSNNNNNNNTNTNNGTNIPPSMPWYGISLQQAQLEMQRRFAAGAVGAHNGTFMTPGGPVPANAVSIIPTQAANSTVTGGPVPSMSPPRQVVQQQQQQQQQQPQMSTSSTSTAAATPQQEQSQQRQIRRRVLNTPSPNGQSMRRGEDSPAILLAQMLCEASPAARNVQNNHPQGFEVVSTTGAANAQQVPAEIFFATSAGQGSSSSSSSSGLRPIGGLPAHAQMIGDAPYESSQTSRGTKRSSQRNQDGQPEATQSLDHFNPELDGEMDPGAEGDAEDGSPLCDGLSVTRAGGEDETDVETGAETRKRSRMDPNAKDPNDSCLLFGVMGGDMWPTLCSYLDMTEIFQAREVCNRFFEKNNEALLTISHIVWDHRWNQEHVIWLLRRCRNVRHINAAGCFNMVDERVQLIARNTVDLESLDLSGCSRIATKSVDILAETCTNLRSLRLRACKRVANIEAATSLTRLASRCPNLEHLDLRCCNMEDEVLINLLRVCKNLRTLDIGSTGFANVSDDVMFALAQNCNKLEQLGVMCCRQISDRGVEAVARGCGATLKHFTVHCCFELTNVSLVHLSQHCKQLESLNVHRCFKISNFGIESLAEGCGATLRALDVSACKIDDNAIEAIARHCPHLRVLDVRSCDSITSKSISAIAKGCPQLEQIDLSGCKKLDDSCIYDLANFSKNLTMIEFGSLPEISEAAEQMLKDTLGSKASIF